MGLSLKPQHLKRYKDVAVLLMKYGRSDLVKAAGLDPTLDDESPAATATDPAASELANDLERMGPTFIKLGQLLSTRPDILPLPYLQALTRLQDRVEPFSFAEVESIVISELGVRLSKAFSEFEAKPVAAASLGQVHRAAMRDGRPVAVKVQRPDIRERVMEDLDALEEIAEFLDDHTEMGRRYGFVQILDEFRRSLLRELDYRQEAQNLTLLRRNLSEFSAIVVPAPIEDYTTSRVLTMEYVSGTKITTLSPVALLELNGAALAEQLFRAYLKQILVDGFFHADPHPGNVLVTDAGQIALLDLGMVGRIAPRLQEPLLQLLLAISEGQSDDAVALRAEGGRGQARLRRAGVLPPSRRSRGATPGRRAAEHAGGQGCARDRADIGRRRAQATVRAHHARQDPPEPGPDRRGARSDVQPERVHPSATPPRSCGAVCSRAPLPGTCSAAFSS